MLLPACRFLFAASLSGWIAGPARAVEEEVIEEETVEAPAPKPAPAPATTPAPSSDPGASPGPAAAPAAPTDVAKPSVEPNPVTLNPGAADAEAPAESNAEDATADAEPGEASADGEPAAEGEGEEGVELADEPAAEGESGEPEVAAPAVAVAEPAAAAPVVEPAEESVEADVTPAEPEPVAADVAPVEESSPAAIPVIAPEAPQPLPVWNARAQEAAFTDFLRAGIPVDPLKPTAFAARVAGATDAFRSGSVQREQLFITGAHASGRVFAVYRVTPGARLARYVGLVSMLRSAGADRTRAVVLRSMDIIQAGDGLVALDDARSEFDAERSRANRDAAKAGEAAGRVVCFHEDREIQTQPDDVLLVDRGSRDGITLAWVCEMPQEGSDRVAAYGRVVRLTPDACLVRVLKSYEPVRAGVTARLASRPASDRARAGRGR